MKRKKPEEKYTPSSSGLDLDSLLKLASNLNSQESLLNHLSRNPLADDSDDVDLSGIMKDICEAASHTFSGIEEKLNVMIEELKKLNNNLESLNTKVER
ncbi:hypothetical protein J0K78_07880 [Halobacillus sp. GSS1]|uniref:hypothetical protein n=1 Tax=Halobacillus sp. GSS1 TaxID=2815919 RepID=UPI001A8D1CA2|nr:hypothetical protein [Halobacillus sp. GSS1]MBN9654180.1 hypothetical protein [Halobacillus sp. GSS1]